MKTIKNLTAEELRKSILQLAIQGKLVKQNPDDEPASELVKRIYEEKNKLIAEGKIKKDKNPSYIFKGDDNCYYEKIDNNEPIKLEDLPFDIPDNWTWIRLKNLCQIIFSGKSPKYSKEKTNNIAIGQAANTGFKIDLSLVKYCTDEFVKDMPNYYYLQKYDILLNTLGHGTLGRCGIYELNNKDILTDGHLFVFRLFDKVTSIILHKFFVLNRTNIEKSSNGTTNQIFLSLSTVGDYLFPLPPLEEQQRIVDKINSFEPLLEKYDKVEQELSKLEKEFPEKLKKSILQYAIEGKLVKQDPNDEPASVLLERIKQEKERLIKERKIKRDKNESYIYQGDDKNYYEKVGNQSHLIDCVFDIPYHWNYIKLSDVILVARGGSPRPIQDYLTNDKEGINWIKIGDTDLNSKYIVSCKEKIKKSGLYKTRYVRKGDFLLTNSMSFGHPYILAIDGCIHDGWLVLSDKYNAYDKDYLYYLLSSPYVYKAFCSNVGGSVVKNLNSYKVSNTIVPLLPLSEQKKIADKLDYIFNYLIMN